MKKSYKKITILLSAGALVGSYLLAFGSSIGLSNIISSPTASSGKQTFSTAQQSASPQGLQNPSQHQAGFVAASRLAQNTASSGGMDNCWHKMRHQPGNHRAQTIQPQPRQLMTRQSRRFSISQVAMSMAKCCCWSRQNSTLSRKMRILCARCC